MRDIFQKLEALASVCRTERRDEALRMETLAAHCAGVDLERLQDFQALNGAWRAKRTLGGMKVRTHRKLLKALLK